ncbi:MAG: pitrilysin family protein, partial [Myxococcota bacterium]
LNLPIEQHRLENGLRVVLCEDHAAPTVAVAVYYDVGSRDEPPGRTGFAHLFEHMMFEGSRNVPKFGHIQFVQRVGGVVNGTTSGDRTNYFEQVPSNYLSLALWLEADRMRSLHVTQENFENQRQTVKEERRQSYDNRPYAKAFLRMNELAYENFAYKHSTIGEMADLDAAPIEAVQQFFRTYYAPNNALVSIAGDFVPAEALALVKEHFGDIPRGSEPPRSEIVEPPQTAEKSEAMDDPLARLPAFFLAWHIPPSRSADAYPLEVLSTILGDGKSSRLYRKLVDEKKVANSISIDRDDRRGPDLFNVWAICNEGAAATEVRDLVLAEIDAIRAGGATERELEKAKNRIRARFTFGLQGSLSKALRLAEYAVYWGDPALLLAEPDRYQRVTLDDVKRVAAQYLDAKNRTYLEIVPKAE